jgi:transposase
MIRFGGEEMPKPYSCDLRVRVIELIEAGSSRREAAELYGISASVVVIWAQRWKQTGSISLGGANAEAQSWFASW